MKRSREPRTEPELSIRVLLPMGKLEPGKLEMMRLIAKLGSVSAASRIMRMSHARSVHLVAELNALGPALLVETRAGGEHGGGASLTEAGRELLALQEELDAALKKAAAPYLSRLAKTTRGE